MGCDQSQLIPIPPKDATNLGEYLRLTKASVTYSTGFDVIPTKGKSTRPHDGKEHIQFRINSDNSNYRNTTPIIARLLCNFLHSHGYPGKKIYLTATYNSDWDVSYFEYVDGGSVITSKQKWLDYKAALVAEGVVFRNEPRWTKTEEAYVPHA
jgi:hypothetical protein